MCNFNNFDTNLYPDEGKRQGIFFVLKFVKPVCLLAHSRKERGCQNETVTHITSVLAEVRTESSFHRTEVQSFVQVT